ncbi:MAG: type 1 glutamine amidotransferase [Paenirhodobacter sp.]|uniref:type 1 glutamine amidotransferase n=1 Tax=Paenirhodobacter sp. TaxID=1965326 RepID=UPI003D11FD42
MKIGILQTGRAPDELRAEFGDYDAFFRRLLAGRGFTFETWAVLDSVLPPGPAAADGWIITGSRFGVYEDHPWIAPLEDLVRAIVAARVPLVGICFGHQLVAQALGGKVERFAGGWSVGAVDYDTGAGAQDRLLAWHRDQVVTPPEGARTIAATPFCRHAALAYGDHVLTLQPHPEFTPEFLRALIEARRDLLPPEVAQAALDSLAAGPAPDTAHHAAMIADVLGGSALT